MIVGLTIRWFLASMIDSNILFAGLLVLRGFMVPCCFLIFSHFEIQLVVHLPEPLGAA